ncbi:hypothetical protein BJX76DRAFT_348963 [Aspergillus varians]
MESSRLCCVACGWTLDTQKRCHYTSHLKLFYSTSTRGVWSIGSNVILKDRPDEGPKAKIEVKPLKYLATYTDIHVPNVLHDWVDRDGRYFILNERLGVDALSLNLHNLPQQLWERLPKCEPYVLTHCDLNLGNIMAAYFPIWYEYVSASFGFTHMDVEWKKLLRERLGIHDETHEDARVFWIDMCDLR